MRWVRAASTSLTYDADGNLLSDGRVRYTWDGENRLAAVQNAPLPPAGAPVFEAAYEYDDLGRRVRKIVTAQTPLGPRTAMDRRFLYDGWNLVAEVGKAYRFHTNSRGYVYQLPEKLMTPCCVSKRRVHPTEGRTLQRFPPFVPLSFR